MHKQLKFWDPIYLHVMLHVVGGASAATLVVGGGAESVKGDGLDEYESMNE